LDLIFNGIAPRVLHSDWLNVIKGDITYRASSANTLRTGLYVSGESIELDDRALTFPATDGAPTSTIPITVIDNHNNFVWLLGTYVEDEW
jgi:hypothetical protein